MIAFNDAYGEMHAELSFYEHHLHMGQPLEIIRQYCQILHELSLGRVTTLSDARAIISTAEA